MIRTAPSQWPYLRILSEDGIHSLQHVAIHLELQPIIFSRLPTCILTIYDKWLSSWQPYLLLVAVPVLQAIVTLEHGLMSFLLEQPVNLWPLARTGTPHFYCALSQVQNGAQVNAPPVSQIIGVSGDNHLAAMDSCW